MGWLARQHGLTCDNVEWFEVVEIRGHVHVHAPVGDPPVDPQRVRPIWITVVVSGTAILDSLWLDVRLRDADLVHSDGDGERVPRWSPIAERAAQRDGAGLEIGMVERVPRAAHLDPRPLRAFARTHVFGIPMPNRAHAIA